MILKQYCNIILTCNTFRRRAKIKENSLWELIYSGDLFFDDFYKPVITLRPLALSKFLLINC